MKLSDIQEHWNTDCVIDRTALDVESLKIPELHSKYYNILNQERLKMKHFENQMKKLLREKWLYYSGKGTAQQYAEKPFDLKILKSDIPRYLESDEEVLTLQQKIDVQEEKVLTLTEIVRTINNRNWVIRNALEWQKFINGVG